MVRFVPSKVQSIVRKVLRVQNSPSSSLLNASASVHAGKLGADSHSGQYSSQQPQPRSATVSNLKVASLNDVDRGEDAYEGDLEDNDADDSEYNFPFSPLQTMNFEEVRGHLVPSQDATVGRPVVPSRVTDNFPKLETVST